MRVAIAADLQFAEQGKLSHQTDTGITSRLADQIECFEWIVDQATTRSCEELIVIGDLYDSRRSIPVPVLDQVGRAFAKAAEHVRIAVVAGNHDVLLRTPRINSLQSLLGSATIWDEPGTDGEFAFVPWMEDPDDYRHAIGTVAKDKAARYLFSHVMIEGAVPADVGKPKRDLRPQRWARVFLGDVHEPMEFDPNIQYAGAPMQHHYGDAGGVRGFFTLDTVTNEAEFIENDFSPRFHILTDEDASEVSEGDFVRIRVADVDEAEAIAADVGRTTDWVESEAVRLDDVAPRMDVSTAEPAAKLLRRYVEHMDVDVEGLLAVGLELLAEVE